jgi:hypothetical protein
MSTNYGEVINGVRVPAEGQTVRLHDDPLAECRLLAREIEAHVIRRAFAERDRGREEMCDALLALAVYVRGRRLNLGSE